MLRFIGYLFGIGTVFFFLVAGGAFIYVSSLKGELPDYEVLRKYEPPVTSRIHASNGALLAEYARQRRLFLPIQAMPDLLKEAFLSAEDKNFYKHSGVSFPSLGKAAFDYGYAKLRGVRARARGASTITQQVAKNFLLTSDRTVDRKIKEALLAFRIEEAYSKDKILELYLNEIYLGLGAYGVAGASLAYFGKPVGRLDVAEVAYLAALPKAPSNYHPYRNTERALTRRNWVIGRMLANGFITQVQADAAKAKDLGVALKRQAKTVAGGEYFTEAVRREIIDRYGNDSLYEGGLSIRTTVSPILQDLANAALRRGLKAYDRARGYHGAFAKVTLDGGDWGEAFSKAKIKRLRDLPSWRQAVVLSVNGGTADIGFRPEPKVSGGIEDTREVAKLYLEDSPWARTLTETTITKARNRKRIFKKAKSFEDIFAVGDVIHVSNTGGRYVLEQVPEVSGALVAMDPHTGRVLALSGGFSYSDSQFNRATQARRQPGSAFKPFIYAAALDNGYTPSSVVMDGPIKIDQGGTLGIWEPKNYSGKYAGPSTLRRGIEQSRNLMTVRLANDMGMKLISEYAKRFGIYDRSIRGLASSLGSRETTALKMVSAYAVLANGGKRINPSLIDRIQDRYGKTIYKHEERTCDACTHDEWSLQQEPDLVDNRDQVLDPMTAYQITSIMEGVVLRGTAKIVGSLGVPIAGKTGTTNEERDAWFVGYSPDLVVGVFVGYDRPEPMGKGNTGGGLAAPIFVDFMKDALAQTSAIDFRVPEGIKLYPINAKTGLLAQAGNPGVIMESFKPGTKPPARTSIIGFESDMKRGTLSTSKAVQEAVQEGAGGLF
ncbi:MAG: penicillin-binding protein 1A [Pseudomonadota bacterium]